MPGRPHVSGTTGFAIDPRSLSREARELCSSGATRRWLCLAVMIACIAAPLARPSAAAANE
jgi:hypothetical protein